jgi:molecular chaperone GrpE
MTDTSAADDRSRSGDQDSSLDPAATGAVGEPTGISAGRLEVEAAELRAELEQTRELAQERLAGAQRAQADYENLKKRNERERSELGQSITVGLLGQLLPLVDDLELALQADPDKDPTAWMEGLRLIQGKVVSVLEGLGLQPVAAVGQPFDPHFHEGVGEVPGEAGVVVTQVQKGYLLNGHVLRPSRVLVGNGKPSC